MSECNFLYIIIVENENSTKASPFLLFQTSRVSGQANSFYFLFVSILLLRHPGFFFVLRPLSRDQGSILAEIHPCNCRSRTLMIVINEVILYTCNSRYSAGHAGFHASFDETNRSNDLIAATAILPILGRRCREFFTYCYSEMYTSIFIDNYALKNFTISLTITVRVKFNIFSRLVYTNWSNSRLFIIALYRISII